MSALYFDARIDGAQLQKDIANINKQLGRITQNVKKEGDEIDTLTRRMGAGLKTAFGVGGLFAGGAFIKDIARVRGEFQQLEVAFETMLGSKEKADKLFAQVVDFAGRTPFELADVATGAKQLLAYGTAAEDILPTLKSLGDVSAGLSVPIERLILNYGQVRSQLKLTGRELRDFNVAGVPLVAELAKNLGVAESKIADMVEKGKIGFPEVEAAFRSMTYEGGRFNNLMDKQAKTITGLASNFADAWDKMLNAIGQQNEGVIADTIKGAISLTEHYEDVLNVLKVIAVTYGTYKAAVIASGIATRVSATYGVYDIATKKLQAAATLKAATAQTALNTAASVNPYIAIATAVAGLITLFTVYGNETKKAEDYVNDLNDTVSKIGEQTKVDDLIEKYDELNQKTNKTEAEQAELNSTISQLASIFPAAITKVDEYGKALGLSADKLIELNDQMRENSKILAQKTLTDSQKQLNTLLERQSQLQKEINEGKFTYTDNESGITKEIELSEKGMLVRRKELEALGEDIKKLGGAVASTQDSIFNLGKIDVDRFKAQYSELFSDVSNLTKEQAEETKNSLEKLLVYQFGDEISKTIRSQIDILNKQLALPTIQEQITKTTSELKKAQGVLDAMRAPNSSISVENIDKQESVVKELESTLAKLTGVTKKDGEKRAKDEEARQKEMLQSLIDFNEQKLSLERSYQAAKIAIMQNGSDREKAEAELEYKQQLDQINKQQQDFLESYNAKNGAKPGDRNYVTEIPKEDLDKFNALRVAAEEQKNKKIEQINYDTAQRIKAIWEEINQSYLSDNQKEIAAINKKYEGIFEAAKKGEASLLQLAAISQAKQHEIDIANTNTKLEQLDFEEQAAIQKAEISTQGFNKEVELEKKKLQIVKDTATKKLNLLKATDQELYANEIKLLEGFIEASDKGLEGIATKEAQEYLKVINQISDVISQMGTSIGKMNSELGEGVNMIGNILGGFARGGALGGIAAFVNELISGIASTKGLTDEEAGDNRLKAVNEAINRTNKLLEYQLNALNDLDGSDWFKSALKQVAGLNSELTKTWNKLNQIAVYSSDRGHAKIDTAAWDAEQWQKAIAGKFYNFNAGDRQAAQEYLDQWLKIDDEINKIKEEQNQRLTGTTGDAVADSIIEGFKKGYDSAEDFAANFEELMVNAIVNAFRTRMLEEGLNDWYESFSLASEDGLTSEEITVLRNSFNSWVASEAEKWKEIEKVTGINPNDLINTKQQGLTGDITRITEETGGLIAGNLFAVREMQQKSYMTGLEQLDGINQSVSHLAEIAQNTRHNSRLIGIEEGILSMIKIMMEKL
ncbi:MAG TPA: hypothetical protein DHV48_03635 [Prolixibacteraceae bacterium]|nr:hypothetical protein [Prolixibacteraceae bacterium]